MHYLVRIIGKYKNTIRELVENDLDDNGTTAAEIIHMYSKYDDDNLDCWLELPKEMLDMVDSYQSLLDSRKRNVYYIEEVDEPEIYEAQLIEKELVNTDE